MPDLGAQAEWLYAAGDLLKTLPAGWGEALHLEMHGQADVILSRAQQAAHTPDGWPDWTAWLVRVAATRTSRVEVHADPRAVLEGRFALDLAIAWRHVYRGFGRPPVEIGVTLVDPLHRLNLPGDRDAALVAAQAAVERFRADVAAAKAARSGTPGPAVVRAGQPDLFAGVS